MTDNDRNIRTLIICFVLALFALVPMRVMQGTSVVLTEGTQVLGETDTENGERVELIYLDEVSDEEQNVVEEVSSESDEVVLPDAEVVQMEE